MFALQLTVIIFSAIMIPVFLGRVILLFDKSRQPPRWTKRWWMTFSGLCLGLILSVILAALAATRIQNIDSSNPKPGSIPTPIASPSATPEASPLSTPKAPTITPMSKDDESKRDNFGSASSGWDIINESYGSSGYKDGKYFIDLSEYRLFAALWQGVGPLVDNMVLEVDILGPFGTPGMAQGLVFGWHKDWQGTTYAFTVDGAGQCAVASAVNKGGWHKLASGTLQEFDPDESFYTLHAVIRNRKLQGYVNGDLCIEYRIPDYKPGYIGVAASPDPVSKQGQFEFDEFRFYQIP